MPDTSTTSPPPLGGAEMTDPQRQHAWIAGAQRDLNRFLSELGSPSRIAVDGEWDEFTESAFRDVCRILGIAPERSVRTFRLIAGAAAVPTADEVAKRQSDGAAFAQALRAKFAQERTKHMPQHVVVGGKSLPKADRDLAYIAFVQRTLNDYLLHLGSPTILAVDGKWGKDTQRAFEQICHVLGVQPERRMRTFRIVAGALAARTEAEEQLAATQGKAFEQQLRAEFAQQAATMPEPAKPKPEPVVHHKPPAKHPASAPNQRIAAAIRAHGGQYEAEILAASAATQIPVAFLCAVLDVETSFSNVFGHDGVANPIKSPRGSNRPVTKDLYLQYKHFRDRGQGCQGVGPMQLTSKSFQDRADALGGCWLVGPNIRIGAEVIRECIAAAGGSVHGGFTRYNGASVYADNMLKVIAKWQGFLGTKAAAEGGAIATSATFHPSANPPFSAEVQSFQRMLNRRYKAWKIDQRIAEDGRFGAGTRDAAAEIASGMGIARVDFAHGFSPKVRRVMAHPATRTAKQKERAAQRGAYRARLRTKYKSPVASTASVSKLLGSHRKPSSAALMKVIAKAGTFGLVVTATTDGVHSKTSLHYSGHAVDFGVTPDLAGTPEHMRRLKAFQLAMFKDAPHLLELFGPIANRAVKNGSPTTISGDLLTQHLNHVHVAAK